MAGIPPMMLDFLNRKYAIDQQNANTEQMRVTGPDVARYGSAYNNPASWGGAGGNTSDPLELMRQQQIQAEIAKTGAETSATKSAASIAQDENLRSQLNFNQGLNANMWTDEQRKQIAAILNQQNVAGTQRSTQPGLKKGIARVPGKGDGTKDTVSKKLAPGEAVLNKAAADHLGRGMIGVLNAIGQQKMGMT